MARKKILTQTQEKFLSLFEKCSPLVSRFYLSGGTALAGFYLFHRFSEDLDFFSQQEVDVKGVFSLLHGFINPLGFKKIEFQQSFNRNLFFFIGKEETLKTEFTYFPFEPLEKSPLKNSLAIDSLKDIAVNKVFTIYQKPRMRDFIDLFIILKKKKWPITELLKMARIKFDTHIDRLQWGSKLLQVRTLKDFPRMIAPINFSSMEDFFVTEAQRQKGTILEYVRRNTRSNI